MQTVGLEDRIWTAGFFDGDGCVLTNGVGGVVIQFTQAEKGWGALRHLETLWGGTLSFATVPRSSRHQLRGNWRVSGDNARKFCREVADHAFLKGNQLSLALRLPRKQGLGICATAASADGKVYTGESLNKLAKMLDIPPTNMTRYMRRGSGRGYTFAETARNTPSEEEEDVHTRLQKMKKEEHVQIDASLPMAYVAGFLEADGHFHFDGRKHYQYPAITVTQKYGAIITALESQFGGHKRCPKGYWHWNVRGVRAIALITGVLPHLVIKRDQAELLLRCRSKPSIDDRNALKAMHNRQCK